MTCNYTWEIARTVPCKYKKASSFFLGKPVPCDFPRNPIQQHRLVLFKMFKFSMITLMTIFAMIALAFAHPSSYGSYNAPKGNDAKGYEYSAQPAPVYGSGYDRKIYGEYEGHAGLYKETKGY